jgi:uncharacterized integral membrane protein
VRKIDTAKARIPGTNLRGWRAIAVGALALYIVLFIVLNNRQLEVNFVFFKTRSNELLSLIVIVILGFAAGFIVGGRHRRARPSQAQPRTIEPGTEATPPAPPGQGTAVGRDDDPARSPS